MLMRIVVLGIAAAFLSACGMGTPNLRPSGDAFAPCDKARCVSSQQPGTRWAIEPLRYSGSRDAAHAALFLTAIAGVYAAAGSVANLRSRGNSRAVVPSSHPVVAGSPAGGPSRALVRLLPLDKIVQELLGATGGTFRSPATNFYQIDLEGRHVLLIDDILDTGRTLAVVIEELRKRRPTVSFDDPDGNTWAIQQIPARD